MLCSSFSSRVEIIQNNLFFYKERIKKFKKKIELILSFFNYTLSNFWLFGDLRNLMCRSTTMSVYPLSAMVSLFLTHFWFYIFLGESLILSVSLFFCLLVLSINWKGKRIEEENVGRNLLLFALALILSRETKCSSRLILSITDVVCS